MIDAERVANQLELILELISAIDARLEDFSREMFIRNPAEVDLTAFRLSHIGETARRLPPEITNRHPAIPWRLMSEMRNIIAHDYRRIDPARIWETAVTGLDSLAEVCRTELERLT